MNIVPIGNRVLLKPIEEPNEINGFLIPDQSKDKPIKFEVVSVGEGFVTSDGTVVPITNLSIGDSVVIPRHLGFELKNDEGIFRIVNAQEILAVLKD